MVATGEGAVAAMKEKAEKQAVEQASTTDGVRDVLWRANLEEFNRRFRCARVCTRTQHVHDLLA